MNNRDVEAKRWFKQAETDLQVAKMLIVSGYYAAACFHCQQSAEKAMKSVLYSKGTRFVIGHSVADLARKCNELDSVFADSTSRAGLLDQFYIPTRYPNALPSPAVPSETYTKPQAELACDSAGQIMLIVEQFLREHTKVFEV